MPVLGGLNGKILGPSSVELKDVTEWSATLSANNKEYGSSSTSGHTQTVKGRINGELNFTVKNNSDDEVWEHIKIGDQVTLEAFEDANRLWIFPCRIESMEPTVQIEDAEVEEISVSAQLHGAFTYPDSTLST